MRFFERIIEPRPPLTAMEGGLKLLALSNLCTTLITLSADFTNIEDIEAKSVIVNFIHFLAFSGGFLWGAYNQWHAPNNQPGGP